MCRGADAYVQTVIRHDLVSALADALPNGQRMRDILDYHSSVEQAAQTATRAGVKNLVLTHYVPPMAPGQEDDWKSHATAHFDGPVILGPDLTSIEV
jgi:ribonuclease Z